MAMSDAKQGRKERVFTVELNSTSDVKNLSVQNGVRRTVIEGTIGALKHAGFVEDTVLELTGTRGVLRVDLSMEDLAKRSNQKEGETN
jgi:predicted deacylase